MKSNTFLLLFLLLASFRALAYEAELPLFDKERYLGDVKAEVEDEKLISLSRDSLTAVLSPVLKADTLKSFRALPERLDPSRLPIPVRFDHVDLKLVMNLDLTQLSSDKLNLMEDHHHRYDGEALKPSTFGGAINYRLEQTMSSLKDERAFTGQMDSFVNMGGVVLENQTYYQSNVEREWYRGDTRLVRDFEKDQVRVQAGDVYPQVQGFMSGRPVGGINVARNFSLNPYRLPYPTAAQNFSLQARSYVKYFVNGTLVKSEFLPAGNYSVKDIPLANGMNTVLIEATDDLGQKKTFVFRTATSIDLLNEGESRFDLSYGTPFLDQNFKREYVSEDGNLASGFFQYGFRTDFSGSLYAQNQKSFNLYGSELLKATALGNFGIGYGGSRDGELQGDAASARYQYIGQGNRWYQTNSLGLRYEQRSKKFRTSIFDTSNAIKNNYAVNYALPVANSLTLSVGGNYGDMYDNSLDDRYGFDSTVSLRFLQRHNLSVFVGRNRDEFRRWNDIAYVFVTITFPDSNDFVSAFYDQQQKSSRLTYIKDNQNRLYSPRAQGIVENSETHQLGEADVLVPTQLADIGARVNARHLIDGDKVIGRGSLRVNSAFVFAKGDDDWGLGISRPVPGSFAIFKTEEKLKGQKIAMKSTSPYAESQTGLFDEVTFNNLLPYQYREIQLDPSFLDEGRTLKKEKFVLYPTYKSAHLITLSDKGVATLKGHLLKKDGTPWALQVGHYGDKTFFTNREGMFFIESVEPGKAVLKLEGSTSQLSLTLPEGTSGIKDLGNLTLEEDE